MPGVSGAGIRPGDVLEAECDSRVGLLGYVGRHHKFGDLVLVPPRLFTAPVDKLCSVFDASAYFQFYPATTALRHRMVRKVGFCTEAMRVIPARWCNIIDENEDGTVRVWNVCDGSSRIVRYTLSDDERQLPIGEIVNHAVLLQRLREAWTPDRYHARDA